jgi:membrane-associated phospholipid phosphatase
MAMQADGRFASPDAVPVGWRAAAHSLSQPYPVTLPMVALILLVPFYIFIAEAVRGRAVHAPELALDRMLPLKPEWALVYGPLYLFLILLPVFVVRQPIHVRRTFCAYLTVWTIAFVCFLAFPTTAPRPALVAGNGFAVWGLRFLYAADPPYNCFPSIHVAHSFVSALTCFCVHRRVGVFAMMAASIVAVSTLFTKQHYVLDVLAGVLLAAASAAVWLRTCPRPPVLERRLAPFLALGVLAVAAVALACSWVGYLVTTRL